MRGTGFAAEAAVHGDRFANAFIEVDAGGTTVVHETRTCSKIPERGCTEIPAARISLNDPVLLATTHVVKQEVAVGEDGLAAKRLFKLQVIRGDPAGLVADATTDLVEDDLAGHGAGLGRLRRHGHETLEVDDLAEEGIRLETWIRDFRVWDRVAAGFGSGQGVGDIVDREERTGQPQLLEGCSGREAQNVESLSLPTESPDTKRQIGVIEMIERRDHVRRTGDDVLVRLGVGDDVRIGNRLDVSEAHRTECDPGCGDIGSCRKCLDAVGMDGGDLQDRAAEFLTWIEGRTLGTPDVHNGDGSRTTHG